MKETALSDQEFSEALKRTQEETKDPEGDLDLVKLLDETDALFVRLSQLTLQIVDEIFKTAHADDGWIARFRLRRSFDTFHKQVAHMHECKKCQPVMVPVIKGMVRGFTKSEGGK